MSGWCSNLIIKRLLSLRQRFNQSIVFRTTALIVLIGVLIGLLATLGGAAIGERQERARLYQGLEDLVTAVERTASVAVYAHDAQLAGEVASGLKANRAVAQVVIVDDDTELVRQGTLATSPSETLLPVQRALHSPFNESEIIGRLILVPASAVIDEGAKGYSRFIALMLALEILVITLMLIWLVTRYVVRPIKVLSDELHTIDIEFGGGMLSFSGRHGDEIARLARDVNKLIARMRNSLAVERELRAAHQAAEQKWRLIFENAETGIFTLTLQGFLHDWNPWLEDVLNLPSSDSKGESGALPDLAERLGDDQGLLRGLVLRVMAEGKSVEAEFEVNQSKQGKHRWLNLVLTPLDGGHGMLQGIVNDISGSKLALARASRMAEHDTLTGLLNRRGLEHVSQAAMEACSLTAGIAVMLIDLDGFKQVNDTLGHEAGDQLLIAVARRIEAQVRQSDHVVRLGGDEFVVLLRDINGPDVAGKVAQKIVGTIARPFEILNETAQIGASIGVACHFAVSGDLADLMRRADEAMYKAKNAGKSRFFLA